MDRLIGYGVAILAGIAAIAAFFAKAKAEAREEIKNDDIKNRLEVVEDVKKIQDEIDSSTPDSNREWLRNKLKDRV